MMRTRMIELMNELRNAAEIAGSPTDDTADWPLAVCLEAAANCIEAGLCDHSSGQVRSSLREALKNALEV